MENTIEQNVEETSKKAWIAPEMEEVNIMSGSKLNPGEGGGYSPLPS